MKNHEIIKGIVKKHFFIDEEGFKTFSDRLDNPVFNETIQKLLEGKEERRARFDLPDEEMHRFDQGWKEFKESLSEFVIKYNVSYQDFRENLVTVGKQRFKIKKVLLDYYKEKTKIETISYNNGLTREQNQNIINLITDLTNEIIVLNFVKQNKKLIKEDKLKIIGMVNNIIKDKSSAKEVLKLIYKKINKENNDLFEEKTSGETRIKVAIKDRFSANLMEVSQLIGSKNITDKTVVYKFGGKSKGTEKELEEWVTDLVTRLTSNKISKDKKIQVVVSGNFSDWFLASTAEEWKSCINLESEYNSCYWAGLPGLVGDPNRLMVYVTDGKQKTYEGITTDRFLSRSWISHTNDDHFCLIRWFPIKMVEKNLIEKLTGIKCFDAGDKGWRTKSPITLINGEIDGEKRSLFIYNDNCGFKSEGENFHIASNGSGGFSTVLDGKNIKSMSIFAYGNGLKQLIRSETNIKSFAVKSNRLKCPICGNRHDRDYMNSTEDGLICPDCFAINYVRSFTGTHIKKSTAFFVERLSKYFTQAEKTQYLIEINGEHLLIDKEIFKINGYDGWYKKEEILVDFKGAKIPMSFSMKIGDTIISKKDYDFYGFNQENDWELPKVVKKEDAIECLGYWVPKKTHVVTVDNIIMKANDENIVRHLGLIYHKDTAEKFNILFNEKTKRWYKWVDKTQREFKFVEAVVA